MVDGAVRWEKPCSQQTEPESGGRDCPLEVVSRNSRSGELEAQNW